MSSLELPRVEACALALQQKVSRCRTRYPLADGEARLTYLAQRDALDVRLNVHWQGLTMSWRCHSASLAGWLEPHLQEAAFSSLPPPLQLALLELESAVLPGLIWKSIEPCRPESGTNTPTLALTLSRGAQRLVIWLEGVPDALLACMPARPLAELTAIALRLSLQWGPVCLLPAQLHSLATGDLLLLPARHDAASPLLGVVEDRPWARFRHHDSQLELLAMHNEAPVETTQDLASLDQLPVQVSFEVGRQTLDLHTLVTLQPGSLIDLATPLEGEVRILVNQRCLGVGELVSIQDRLGVRITRLLQDQPT
ncbi:type III secretion system cytoplasmic ring protein SctQ [Pseudomonas sp. NPDC087598]|uniref:type III secretion system cytoplasmic ring protein SctQ n=1 Tax=Pseudomonas sp. NPDC087598 TaxID=3364440 RepID=UPI0038148524